VEEIMTYEELSAVVPESVKVALQNYQFHQVMSQMTGLQDFSLGKVAEYMGGMMAARQKRWQPVHEGLQALQKLR
jgi:hypothetical protein